MTFKDKKIRHLELENAELRMCLKYIVDMHPPINWENSRHYGMTKQEITKQKVIIQSLFSLNILETPNDSDDADLPVCVRCGITVPKSAKGGRRKPMCGKCYLRKKQEDRRKSNA